jgi:hypothetical protein
LDRPDLIIAALQQRIGQLVSDYETQIAVLRAELTQLIDEKGEREKAIQEYSNSLNNDTN